MLGMGQYYNFNIDTISIYGVDQSRYLYDILDVTINYWSTISQSWLGSTGV